jgi:GntR family transcriptional regulator
MQIDRSSPVPLYKQIEDYIRDLVSSGDYDKGKLLPKEEDLAKRLGVSRNTVRQGMYKLVLEGLLIRKKGIGTIVAPRTITTHLDEWHSFTQEMSKRGVSLKNYSVKVSEEAADKTLAEVFQIKKGTKLISLERLRGNDNLPFVYFISWFHPRVGLTGEEDFNQPLYQILEEDLSVFPSRSNEELKAVPADAETAEYLNISEGEAILNRKRLVYDAGDRIIEYNVGFYRGDKFTYSIDIKRDFK